MKKYLFTLTVLAIGLVFQITYSPNEIDAQASLPTGQTVNCDATWNLIDVILIKQHNTFSISDVASCDDVGDNDALYIAECDVNGDGNCSLVDAVIIQQCNVFIENGYCQNLISSPNIPPTAEPTAIPTEGCDPLAPEYTGSYAIDDTGFGTEVDVVVDCDGDTRTITSNALPNHETGEFPNSGNPNTISAQDKTWVYPIEPTFTGVATFAQEPGVGINGIKFEPDTAERATCDTGETHSIEAIQDVTDLGLDFNQAHVQPTGEYHYHGVSDLLIDLYSNDDDLVHVAFAADGHLIYYSKSGAYQPSYRLGADAREGTNCTYTPGGGGETITFGSVKDGALKSDWDYDASYGQLDECNGITIDGEYVYLLTDEYPYIQRCLMGEATATGPGGGTTPDSGTPPDLGAAAAILGVTEQELQQALGAPPPDLNEAATTLGVTVQELQDALGLP